jgi:hypothetical protein
MSGRNTVPPSPTMIPVFASMKASPFKFAVTLLF